MNNMIKDASFSYQKIKVTTINTTILNFINKHCITYTLVLVVVCNFYMHNITTEQPANMQSQLNIETIALFIIYRTLSKTAVFYPKYTGK